MGRLKKDHTSKENVSGSIELNSWNGKNVVGSRQCLSELRQIWQVVGMRLLPLEFFH
jgi:hypothetical protein